MIQICFNFGHHSAPNLCAIVVQYLILFVSPTNYAEILKFNKIDIYTWGVLLSFYFAQKICFKTHTICYCHHFIYLFIYFYVFIFNLFLKMN